MASGNQKQEFGGEFLRCQEFLDPGPTTRRRRKRRRQVLEGEGWPPADCTGADGHPGVRLGRGGRGAPWWKVDAKDSRQ